MQGREIKGFHVQSRGSEKFSCAPETQQLFQQINNRRHGFEGMLTPYLVGGGTVVWGKEEIVFHVLR